MQNEITNNSSGYKIKQSKIETWMERVLLKLAKDSFRWNTEAIITGCFS